MQVRTLLLAILPCIVLPVDDRSQIPDRAAQEASRKRIRDSKVREREEEQIGDQLDTPSGRNRLAHKLHSIAKDEGTEEPGDRYVLYLEAMDVACKAGGMSMTGEIINDLAREFQVDRWNQILDAWKKVDPAYSWQEAGNVEQMVEWTDSALADGETAVAIKLAEAAKKRASKADYPPLVKLANARFESVKALARELDAAKAALKEDAENPGANQVLGSFECAYRGNWSLGLELLEKCGSESLKSAARRERQQATDAEGWQAIAEGWIVAVDREKSARNAAAFRRHAAEYLERALGQLTGLPREQAVTRIADLRRAADEADLELEGKGLDDQLGAWKVGTKVEGARALAGVAPRLLGVIMKSDDRCLEIELVETWTRDGQTYTPKFLWRFERVDHDPRTGRVTYAVRDSEPLNNRRKYTGEVTLRGGTMAGYYSFEFQPKGTKDYTLGGPHDWVLNVK